MRPPTGRRLAALLALALVAAGHAAAQAAGPGESKDAGGADTDPTKPVLFSLRNEFYRLRGDAWQNVFLVRADALLIGKTELPGHARGIILRADVPIPTLHNGTNTHTGLGDLYGQALVVPHLSRPFTVALGTGLGVPTATSQTLGSGKWVLAPAIVPVWFFPKRGFAFVKFQDWFSFAGHAARPSVHYLTVTPALLWRVSRRSWTLVDAESRTDWQNGARTWAKAGVLAGTMLSPRNGVTLKLEVPFGASRPGDWTLKAVLFRTRF